MPTLTVKVTLNESSEKIAADGNYLKLESDQLHLEFDQNDERHEIAFILQENAAGGQFHAHDHATEPGLKWGTSSAPSGFTVQGNDPVNKNVFKIFNTHNGPSATGTWDYQLFAAINGNEYATQWYTTNGTSSTLNPSIKNR